MVAALLLVACKHYVGKFTVASYSIHGKLVLLRGTLLAALQNVASGAFLDALMGTRWAGWYLSALGASVGQDVYVDTIPMVETDLLTLEDRVTLGRGAQLIAFTIENGCMDYLQVRIGADVTIGPSAYVMPGATLEPRCAVGALSVVMKGDTIVEGTYAEGAPLVHLGKWFDPEAPRPGPDPADEKVFEAMRRDTKLPEDIRAFMEASTGDGAALTVRHGPPRVALLTGATGFVGGFILRELLERGVKRVYCLVRASSPDEGASRIRKQVLHHELYTATGWDKEVAPRLVVLCGDLGAPRLGLSSATLAELADDVDVVINNGALVNVTKGYESMRDSNVGAVQELLRLCMRGSAVTPLHQISTVGTLPRGSGQVINEDFIREDPSYLGSGYDRSKWVAEHLVKEAGKAGLPVAVHRLGRIGGDSTSGGANESDYCMLVLKGCLQLKCFPKNFDLDLNIVPGNVAAGVIVDKALDTKAVGRTYHVTNPQPPPFEVAVQAIRELGYEFEEVPYAAWRERLLSCASEDNALRPLEGGFGRVRPPRAVMQLDIDCSNAGITTNTITKEQLLRDFAWFMKVGFFPPLP